MLPIEINLQETFNYKKGDNYGERCKRETRL